MYSVTIDTYVEGTKICSSCHKEYPKLFFVRGRCKDCIAKYQSEYRKRNAIKLAQRRKIHYDNNKQEYLANQRTYRKNNPSLVRKWNENKQNRPITKQYNDKKKREYRSIYFYRYIKRTYGLSKREFISMWINQNRGKCAICNVQLIVGRGKTRTTIIDHDHITGNVRGLLCRQCNVHLSTFENYPVQTARYLGYSVERQERL